MFLNEDNIGPEVADMVSVLAVCPEFCRKPKVLTMSRLVCLCLAQIRLDLTEVKVVPQVGLGTSYVYQKYLGQFRLTYCPVIRKAIFFTNAASIFDWMELFESFAATTVEPG